jgi:hypothetical protein
MPTPGVGPAYPSLPDDARRSTWYHVHRYGGMTAVIEVPMWASDLVDDPAPHPAPAAAIRRLAHRLLRDALEVEGVLQDSEPRLEGIDDPLLRAARWGLELVPGLAQDLIHTPPANDTRAYVGSVDAFARRVPLRAAAMLLRVLRETRQSDDPAAARLERLLATWSAAFAERFRARWVPLEHQVEHQSRTVVAAALHARERTV